MNEQRRLAYLEAMGVASFAPRWVLPGAAPSQLAPLPVRLVSEAEHKAPIAKPESWAGADSDTPVAPVTSNIIGNILNRTELPRRELAGDAPVADTAPANQVQAVRFSLNIWQISPALMVVDSHQPKAALPTATLLSNMLMAKQVPSRLPGLDTLHWPMFKGDFNRSGLSHAREMVNAFIFSRLERQPVRYLWLMGEDAFRAIAPAEADYEHSLGSAVDLPELGCLALIMPSLSDMLLDTSLKPIAWRAIRAYSLTD